MKRREGSIFDDYTERQRALEEQRTPWYRRLNNRMTAYDVSPERKKSVAVAQKRPVFSHLKPRRGKFF